MQKGQLYGFRQGGCNDYLDALRQVEEKMIAPFRQALTLETNAQTRRRLKICIHAIQEEYRRKREAAYERLY